MSWQCPRCNSQRIDVVIVTMAHLEQDGDDFETDQFGDHEWDQGSSMTCTNCDMVGSALQFECNLPIHPVNPCGPMPSNSITLPNRRRTDG